MHTGVIEILIITELKYVRIPTYVVEIYTPEKTPFLHRIVYKQLKRKRTPVTFVDLIPLKLIHISILFSKTKSEQKNDNMVLCANT